MWIKDWVLLFAIFKKEYPAKLGQFKKKKFVDFFYPSPQKHCALRESLGLGGGG